MNVLKERRDNNAGLRKLAIRSCKVHEVEYKSKLRELVKNVKWGDNVRVLNPDYTRWTDARWVDDEPDTDEPEDYLDHYERESYHELHG